MTVNDTGMNALVEELQAAQGELEDAVSRGLLEGQRSVLRVLKVELLGQINEVAARSEIALAFTRDSRERER